MSAATSPSTIRVTCPECGTESSVTTGGRAAADFCPSCDYPLFWAATRAAAPAAAATTEESLYRAPGTSGTTTPSALACPACGERNKSTADLCVRCGADLHPAPPPAPEPPAAPEPVVIVPPTIVECDHWPAWAVAVLASATTLVLAVIVGVLIWP